MENKKKLTSAERRERAYQKLLGHVERARAQAKVDGMKQKRGSGRNAA
jgi:hypothetical protein